MKRFSTAGLFAMILIVLFAVVLVGCSGGGASGGAGTGSTTPPAGSSTGGAASGAATVVEKGFAFSPATLEVKVGDTVTFTNEDSAAHVVQIDGKDLGNQDPGASVTWSADKAGSFPYSCTIHPAMTGEIVVK